MILIAGLIAISRFLTPEEVGYATIAVTIVGVGDIVRDFGLSTAAITHPNISTTQRNSLFWANLSLGIAFALLVLLSASGIAAIFNSPQSVLLLRALAVVFVFGGLGAQFRASLNRNMRFTDLAIIDGVAPLAGVAVGIGIAASGGGYWAIASQTIVTAAVSNGLAFARGPWWPGRPRIAREAFGLLGFGAKVAGAQVLSYLGNNVDTLALGLRSGPDQVGLYNRAFQVGVQSVGLLRDPATAVALPLMSRMRSESRALLRAAVRGQLLIGYTIVPIAVLLSACAPTVVLLLLGPVWESSAPMLAVLAIAAVLQLLASVANWLFLASSQGSGLLSYSAVALVVKVACIAPVAQHGGLWVAAGFLAALAVLWPVSLIWASRLCGIDPRTLLLGGVRPILLGLFGWLAARGICLEASSLPAVVTLGLGFVGLASAYLVGAAIPAVRVDYRAVWSVLPFPSRRERCL